MVLKYIVQHFLFVYCSEVSIGGKLFVRDWKRLSGLTRLSAGMTWSFFGSDTTASQSYVRKVSEKPSIAVFLMDCGAESVSVIPIDSRLQKLRNWLSRKSTSWHNSMLLMAT